MLVKKAMKASELLLQSAEPFDKACMMVREMELEIDRLREALRISTNGLRHCSRWNISEEKEKAIITQVIANEALLTPNVELTGSALLRSPG